MFLSGNKKAVLLATAIACSALEVNAQSETKEVGIDFQAWVGESEFVCGESYEGVGVNQSTITPTDFRFYVSNLALIDESGNAVAVELEQDGKWQYQNVALLDFEDGTGACDNGTAELNTTVVGTVPEGDYQSLQFTMGVPQDLNHEDAAIAPSPLNLTSMWWNWQGGYKFLRVDMETEGISNVGETSHSHGEGGDSSVHTSSLPNGQGTHHQSSSNAYLIHLGSTGCKDSTQSNLFGCANPNRVQVMLEDFSAEDNVVIADLAELLAESDLTTNQANTPNGCMSSPDDADCMPIMQNLSLSSSNSADSEQKLFWVK